MNDILNEIRPYRTIKRRKSKQIFVGNVAIGGDAPIVVQVNFHLSNKYIINKLDIYD
ncbi:MAG: hypothetical protein ACKN9I_07835 [Alphaproteobacteria bacterium]